ncbi:MAG: 2Fe-2S iron-sulfur cluster-binding protein [Kiritimatiellota bacterium]|nr:2Fe-2S iron-sulfur cluster-binding protein [Kiritimatiellota bacterium]
MDESKPITITLNGCPVEADPKETLLNVARRCGVDIPTLCDHKAILPYGACRLCVVDVKWGGRLKLVIACVYQPGEGDVVETQSDRVRHTRRLVLELLLLRCPQVAQIRRLAREYGATPARFQLPEGTATGERCILCGLCVRVCKEVIGQSAIGYYSRGGSRRITSPLGVESEQCIGCRACIHVCPTGALHFEDQGAERVMTELHTRLSMVKCRMCGVSFAAEKQLAGLKGRTAVLVETLETCPACRRQQTCRSLGEIPLRR